MRTMRRFIAIASLLAVCGVASAVNPPPRPLHLVGDHWTPYDPPTDLPPGARLHIVVRGDTLWDLAGTYLGDPYLWPQIWERNPYILDSHWIYPGDPIIIDVAVQPVTSEQEVTSDDTAMSELPADDLTGAGEDDLLLEMDEEMPFPLGSSFDVYCFVRLFEDEGAFPFAITGAEKAAYQTQYSEGDVVYLDGGVEEGVRAGDRFFVFQPRRSLAHPVSNAAMGLVYAQVGQLRVLCAQEHLSLAEVTFACDPVTIGDVLLPFRPIPVPLVTSPDPSDRCDVPNGLPTGYIVYSRDDITEIGTTDLVLIDLGVSEAVYPGQFATVFRDNAVAGMPRLVMGELGVLTVEEGYATARITGSWAPLHVGDRVELK